VSPWQQKNPKTSKRSRASLRHSATVPHPRPSLTEPTAQPPSTANWPNIGGTFSKPEPMQAEPPRPFAETRNRPRWNALYTLGRRTWHSGIACCRAYQITPTGELRRHAGASGCQCWGSVRRPLLSIRPRPRTLSATIIISTPPAEEASRAHGSRWGASRYPDVMRPLRFDAPNVPPPDAQHTWNDARC